MGRSMPLCPGANGWRQDFIVKSTQLPESPQVGCHRLTLATASETAEEMAFCSVVNA